MKKLATLTFIAVSLFLLPSCGDDEEQEQTPQPTNPAATIDGTWRNFQLYMQHFDSNNQLVGESKSTHLPNNQQTQTFTPPSTYVVKDFSNTNTGIYNLSQSKLTVTFSQETITYNVDSLTSTRLVLRDTVYYPSGEKTVSVIKAVR